MLRRRWLIVVGGFALAVALAAAAWVLVPATYERTATQVLMPGKGSLPKGGGNPYLYIGGLSQAADIVVRALGSENILNQVDEEFPGSTVEVERDSATPGPVILITVTAPSDSDAEAVLAVMMENTHKVLNQLQDAESISPDFRISALPVAVDDESQTKRRTALVLSGGLLLVVASASLVLAAMREGLVGRRRDSDFGGVGSAPDLVATVDSASAESVSTSGPPPRDSGGAISNEVVEPNGVGVQQEDASTGAVDVPKRAIDRSS